jgi:hypothetical protein
MISRGMAGGLAAGPLMAIQDTTTYCYSFLTVGKGTDYRCEDNDKVTPT